jgi:hypothetical protein
MICMALLWVTSLNVPPEGGAQQAECVRTAPQRTLDMRYDVHDV